MSECYVLLCTVKKASRVHFFFEVLRMCVGVWVSVS